MSSSSDPTHDGAGIAAGIASGVVSGIVAGNHGNNEDALKPHPQSLLTTSGNLAHAPPHHHHHAHHAPPPLPDYAPLRLRRDSNGSMRGAFTAERRSVHVPSSTGTTTTAAAITTSTSSANSPIKKRSPRKKHKTLPTTADEEMGNGKQAAFWKQGGETGSGELVEEPRGAAVNAVTNSLTYSNHDGALFFPTPSTELRKQNQSVSSNQEYDALLGSALLRSNTFSPEQQQQMRKNAVPPPPQQQQHPAYRYYDEYSQSDESSYINCSEEPLQWCLSWLYLRHYDPTPWLMHDVEYDEDDVPYFPQGKEWTVAGYIRHYLYNPIQPEFTSLQQFCWAVVIGIVMGIYTAVWKTIVEAGVDFVWETVPEFLLEIGVFTKLQGWFPLYHYMWIIPTIFGAFLSYIFVVIPVKIPGQNEWIASLHKSGVQDYRTFWPLFILSTLGMLSGLSLGPELPLVLTSGMFGSWLGLACRQSMLQARVLNLTAASAAIGGFFGFPMAGALFVLELPHRSGLQYFEALTPSTISSIVAVITNRLIVNNDVTGYFKYPFLATSLPSSIFWCSIVYGLFGCAIGAGYLLCVLWCKTWVHDWFHAPHDNHQDDDVRADHNTDVRQGEMDSLLTEKKANHNTDIRQRETESLLKCLYSFGCLAIPEEKYRATVAGAVAGFICGWVAIFVPHTLFWGEAQLQNLIDKGRTPLPVFSDATGDMVALGYCIIDPSDPAAIKAGFSVGCAALITVSKTIVIGISLGTGIIGGHFWGPLFVGCAASHFFSDIVNIFAESTGGFGKELAAYPCLVMLCTMGSAHVVSFRAHMAIMLILTLTISAFSPEDGNPYYGIAGDYSAVFPLLVISVSLSMILSRDMFFYKEQRNRGDILAVPEVLCEPGMEGNPLIVAHDEDSDSDLADDQMSIFSTHDEVTDDTLNRIDSVEPDGLRRSSVDEVTAQDIEDNFLKNLVGANAGYAGYGAVDPYDGSKVALATQSLDNPSSAAVVIDDGSTGPPPQLRVVPPPPMAVPGHRSQLSSERLDELLSMPLESETPRTKHRRKPSRDLHRRTASLPLSFTNEPEEGRTNGGNQVQVTTTTTTQTTYSANRGRANSSSRQDLLVRVSSFGEVDHQPSLLEQARIQAASMGHRRVPSLPRGRSSRKNSSSNPLDFGVGVGSGGRKNSSSNPLDFGVDSGALAFDDFEQSFNNMVNSRLHDD